MFVLQNKKTKQFFCEFQEHINTDTTDIDEAADFHTKVDAERLTGVMVGEYSVERKSDFVNQNKKQGGNPAE